MQASIAPPRHDPLTIRLHWATAALVLLLWGSAQLIDEFPKGNPRIFARSGHMLTGVLLAATLVWRIVWRSTGGSRLPPVPPLAGAGRAVHLLLYALLVGTVLLGLCNAWVRGDSVFGLFRVPAFGGGTDKGLRESVGDLHEWSANLLLIVAGAHALAALAHRYLLHDGVLARMLPARKPGS
jgi:cytochrome b561